MWRRTPQIINVRRVTRSSQSLSALHAFVAGSADVQRVIDLK